MKNKQAFTLIELLVVVLIIGILAAVALPQYQKTVEKSRAIEAVYVQRSLVPAVNAYYLNNSGYTGISLDKLDVAIDKETLQYFTFGFIVFKDGHLDLYQVRNKGARYVITSVFSKGRRTRIYCMPQQESAIEICQSLGADSSCVVSAQCNLSR